MKLPLLILASLLIGSLLLEPTMSMTDYCRNRCSMRCARAGMADRCVKYCGLCCEQCKCVPSGTYGNKHECPCYRDKVSSKGRPKCP